MTAATTAGYTASASGLYGASHPAQNAFNGSQDGNSWISAQDSYNLDGTTTGASAVVTFEGVAGSWVGIQHPNKITVQYIIIKNRDNSNLRNAEAGILWGKRDNATWYRIKDFSGLNTASLAINTIIVNQTTAYDEYRLQITEIVPYGGAGPPAVSIGELELYGTEEGDTSVDVVHRSIPNTPGQQQLAVYWDANDSASYSFADSSNVYDLSGSGVKGTLNASGGFDSTYNAFTSSGSTPTAITATTSFTGSPAMSFSMWVKFDSFASTESSV